MIELEVAVHVGQGLSVAIELADVGFPPDDPEKSRRRRHLPPPLALGADRRGTSRLERCV